MALLGAPVPVEELTIGTKRPGNHDASGSSVSVGAKIRLIADFLFGFTQGLFE